METKIEIGSWRDNEMNIKDFKWTREPDDCWLKGASEDGSETYMIKKGRLSLNLRPPYSKDR